MDHASSKLKQAGFVLLNVWLAYHVFAIAISPAPMPPASPLLVDASRIALPYNQLFFLNHGYHFFAPDPGPSTLISWEIERPGNTPLKGRIPDVSIFPRLRYHRFFMLAENVWGFPEDTQQEALEAYARYFAGKHDADEIRLQVVSHSPSSISRVLAGGQLNDPETYSEEPLGDYDFSTGNHRLDADFLPDRELQLQPQTEPMPLKDAAAGGHRSERSTTLATTEPQN
ncbi:MAG: hypothetical protein R3C59_01300 [Planctomycetaceae bacterium]